MKKFLVLGVLLVALVGGNAGTASANGSQATRMAKEYLSSQAFSKSGLIEQLEYEGFTHSQAVYGVNHSGANWLTQAVKTAREYLSSQSFSRSGLIDQLEFEGFTHYQAVYGVSRGYR